ncbi:hypothetical protein Pcinc_006163 [Petrolisthes cinctipes]|uniref:Uncharacterized protein n=1 Tax=Petrolisthes cinctipes TaxID=88211 RepID=A0AAE1KZT9_PETCI|nr:hypothetical protein Pcinc_006163 [Petrolisthes cinctipes]
MDQGLGMVDKDQGLGMEAEKDQGLGMEARGESNAEKMNHEKATCTDLIANELGLAEVEMEIERVTRMGKSREENPERANPRPLIVQVRTVRDKWEIVKKAKNLRNTENNRYQQAIIVPDLTKKQREEEKVLREQLN